MSNPFYVVDAFTEEPFTGNPAAVVLVQEWPDEEVMLALARELNLSATAYVHAEGTGWHIRWFSPRSELEICGHATVAATHVLLRELGEERPVYRFQSRDGDLGVQPQDGRYELSLPRHDPEEIPEPGRLSDALGVRPRQVYRVRKVGTSQVLLVTLGEQVAVERLAPRIDALRAVGVQALMATAPGSDVDFVSRYFSPGSGAPEDPVTGSAYAALAPFWAAHLGRSELVARQVSSRGGDIHCRVFDARVVVAGSAVTILRGELVDGLLR